MDKWKSNHWIFLSNHRWFLLYVTDYVEQIFGWFEQNLVGSTKGIAYDTVDQIFSELYQKIYFIQPKMVYLTRISLK